MRTISLRSAQYQTISSALLGTGIFDDDNLSSAAMQLVFSLVVESSTSSLSLVAIDLDQNELTPNVHNAEAIRLILHLVIGIPDQKLVNAALLSLINLTLNPPSATIQQLSKADLTHCLTNDFAHVIADVNNPLQKQVSEMAAKFRFRLPLKTNPPNSVL